MKASHYAYADGTYAGQHQTAPVGATKTPYGPLANDQTWDPVAQSWDDNSWQSKYLCGLVDEAADAARRRVAGDPLRAVEYETAAADALAFKQAGYPFDAVPGSVAAGVLGDVTAQQAADDILREAAQYQTALLRLREVRLSAKHQIRASIAGSDIERAKDLAEQTVTAIREAVSGVGNARG